MVDEYSQAEPSSEPVQSDKFNQPDQEASSPHYESEATHNAGLSKTSQHQTQYEDFGSSNTGQNKSDGITAEARVSDHNQQAVLSPGSSSVSEHRGSDGLIKSQRTSMQNQTSRTEAGRGEPKIGLAKTAEIVEEDD